MQAACEDPAHYWGAAIAKKKELDQARVRKFGTNAFPTFLALIGATDASASRVAADLGNESVREATLKRFCRGSDLQELGIGGFAAFGTNAEPAVPLLTSIFLKPESAIAAGRALTAIGPAGVAVLTNAFAHDDPTVRNNAAWAIGEGDRADAKTRTSALSSLTHDEDPTVRGNAAAFLGNSDPGQAIPALIPLLDSPEYYPRARASYSLAQFGPLAKSAAPRMFAIYTNVITGTDKDLAKSLGVAMHEALKKIDPEMAIKAEMFAATTGPLNPVRSGHSTTLMPSGRQLIVGGFLHIGATNTFLAKAELLDPRTGAWSETGELHTPHSYHTATLLKDGRVLIVGGFAERNQANGGAEIYDPATGTWRQTGSLNTARFNHTATLQSDGTVIVAEGHTGSKRVFTKERFRPDTGKWTIE